MASYYEVEKYIDHEDNVKSDKFVVRIESRGLSGEGFMEKCSPELLEAMKKGENIVFINRRGQRKNLKYEVMGRTIYVNNEPSDY
ncbi:hypothetical protein [Leuconostoc citreum]|uniref:hypothetical protein n=1 Tax=Leuconostoc citreum TaxID=33964 RepID=UPI00186B9B8A|nr:hypothetical protein [Leuconostoc citreum]MBE4726247.1 hypothetical protein [Leuconostoc citreum]